MPVAAVGVAVRSEFDASAVAGSSSAPATARADIVVAEMVEHIGFVPNARVLLRGRCCAWYAAEFGAEWALALGSLAQDHVELGKIQAVLPQSVLEVLGQRF